MGHVGFYVMEGNSWCKSFSKMFPQVFQFQKTTQKSKIMLLVFMGSFYGHHQGFRHTKETKINYFPSMGSGGILPPPAPVGPHGVGRGVSFVGTRPDGPIWCEWHWGECLGNRCLNKDFPPHNGTLRYLWLISIYSHKVEQKLRSSPPSLSLFVLFVSLWKPDTRNLKISCWHWLL